MTEWTRLALIRVCMFIARRGIEKIMRIISAQEVINFDFFRVYKEKVI